jgi:hypothetical protein
MSETWLVGNAHPTGSTRLKLWAFGSVKNTLGNTLSDRFTHRIKRVEPLRHCDLRFHDG